MACAVSLRGSMEQCIMLSGQITRAAQSPSKNIGRTHRFCFVPLSTLRFGRVKTEVIPDLVPRRLALSMRKDTQDVGGSLGRAKAQNSVCTFPCIRVNPSHKQLLHTAHAGEARWMFHYNASYNLTSRIISLSPYNLIGFIKTCKIR